jgi:hypothetical protein
MQQLYQILNKTISIQSDDPMFIEEFHKDYQWFERTLDDKFPCDIKIDLHDNQLQINDYRIDLSSHPTPKHYAFQVVISEIMSQMNDYYLIHAGVVKMDDQVIVLSGPPGIGKSTIVKALVDKGFIYYSDDCAPLHKQSGKIYPFPRSMWIVDKPDNTNSIRKKKAIPVIFRSDELEPLKAKAFICLIDDTSDDQPMKLNLSLKSTDNPLIDELKQLPGIHFFRRHPVHAEYCIQYPVSKRITQSIQTVCSKYKKHLWTMYRVPPIRTCFERRAKTKKVSPHQMASEIISEMKMFESWVTPSNNETLMASLMNISRKLQDVNCFFISAGNLISEIETIIEIIRST